MMDITVEELKNKIESQSEIHILDVREEWEYEEGHIEGARHFSVYQIPDNVEALEDWRDKEIFVHCKSGKRSKTAQHILIENGFNNVVNVLGGFDAWSNQ